jgi:hypothetical protein
MRKITLVLMLFLAFAVSKSTAQAILQIENTTTVDLVIYPSFSEAGCVTPAAAVPQLISPGLHTLNFGPTSANVNMFRFYPASCTGSVAASITFTLGSPCSPCPTGGFTYTGNFTDAPCGGGNNYNAIWLKCLNPDASYPYQCNLIRVREF